MNALDCFSTDYATARDRFRKATARLGWSQDAITISQRGPDDRDLTIDITASPTAADPVATTLVITSGLHGVEGFFGSAVQLALMERWADEGEQALPIKVVFIHALNPFGFAWKRRTNEDNVDLNRNFLLPGQSFTSSPAGYARVDPFLNPPHAPSSKEPFLLKTLWALLRGGGMTKLKQAVARGQYDYPRGLFFGGKKPSHIQQILTTHLPQWLKGSQRVLHLDLHTGLGAYTKWKLLIDHPLRESQVNFLDEAYGKQSYEVNLAASVRGNVAYQAQGSLGAWCHSQLPNVDYLYACAEFGTYGPVRMLKALRAENQAWHWCPDLAERERYTQDLMEVFCPADPHWRESVINEADHMVCRAIATLT